MLPPFVYEALPSRVVFGAGSLQKLPEEIDKLGATRALVLCTPEQRAIGADIVVMLGARSAGVFDGAAMHVPAKVAEAARDKAKRVRAE
jgi:maleylacetate reductase